MKVTAAQERVTKLESALAPLDGVEGPEVDSLRTALKRAKEVKLLPLDVQAKECEGFLSRARAHLTELDAKRATVSANIQDAERRLEAMKIQQQSAPPPPPQDADSELRQLRETVAQLKGQLHLTKPAVTLECPSSKRQCRREDFIPNCLEELQEWIRGRQTDLQDAMAAGRPHEVARISDIMCKAAQQWQREVAVGVMPSMVTNSVLRPTYGFRGVRVGEASHPGPAQTRNGRRLQSTKVDSEIGHRSTQIDPEDDPPVRSGRFAPLSSDSDDSPNVHVCRAPNNAIDCGRVAVLSSRIDPSALCDVEPETKWLHQERRFGGGELPSARNADTIVVSTASCAPWNSGNPSQ